MNNRMFSPKWIYFALLFGFWGAAVYTASDAIAFGVSNLWVALLWLLGFSFLIFNVIYMFLASVFYWVLNPKLLEETDIRDIPKTAIIYPLKNEFVGMWERISYTFENNNLPGTDLWILSDSDKEHLEYEVNLIAKLRKQFGQDRVFYRNRPNPTERKQGNVLSWLAENLYYKYFLVCDADSMAPQGTLLKLLKKAEHPGNKDIALFQTFINIAHARTWFAKFQSIGARLSQELYFKTLQTVLGRQISFGHLCLIRTEDFIRIKIPTGILSHDIWDTTYLDVMGKRVVYCHDVKTWDESPANYLEARARDKRWAKGTLQAWPLLFKAGVSLETRFHVFYGIYVYLSHPVLFLWLILNAILADDRFAYLLIFKSNNTLVSSPYMHQGLLVGLIFTLLVIYGHKFVLRRKFRLKDIVIELVFSTLISLNNIYYQTVDILSLPFERLVWKPMRKDPFSTVSFVGVARNIWPTTVIGIAGILYGLRFSNGWLILSLPLLMSFSLSIPIVYWTAQPR